MTTYKMLKTQRGVRQGEVHSVVFHKGSTYDLDENLASEFQTLDIIEESAEEPVEASVEDVGVNIHENWLDTDPAVMRHGELTAEQVVAKDESDHPQTTTPAKQAQGKAEGDQKDTKSEGDAPENKSRKSK